MAADTQAGAAILLQTRPADGVALLRLNRPAVLNALNLELRLALAHAMTSLDADTSVRVIVMASEVVDDAHVEVRALQLAEELAALPALSLRAIKESVLESMQGSLDSGLRFERKAFQVLFATQDKTEGMRARLDKRAPQFVGR